MKRRQFLSFLAGLPVIGKLMPAEPRPMIRVVAPLDMFSSKHSLRDQFPIPGDGGHWTLKTFCACGKGTVCRSLYVPR